MAPDALYPLTFEPIYRDYLWGGRRIADHFGRDLPPGVCAESWEVSDRPEADSRVNWGPHAGLTLSELRGRLGPRLLGEGAQDARFPLLIKVIDARERLSLQVHPDEEGAKRQGGEAKTEIWYVLAADPGARVFCGLQQGVLPERLSGLETPGEAEGHLQNVPISAGDAVFVPGGCVHAIDAGCLLLEIQQNSDTTYRISDWGRTDARGQSRPLHLREALGVIRTSSPEAGKRSPMEVSASNSLHRFELASCPFFEVDRWILQAEITLDMGGGSFEIFFVAAGGIRVAAGGVERVLRSGQSVLIPAACGSYTLRPDEAGGGSATLIRALRGRR